jgi:hypothetical protein
VSVFGREIAVNGVTDMREIHIRLRRNDESKDRPIKINERFHEHVLDEGLTDLVEGALIVAAKSLILGRPGPLETPNLLKRPLLRPEPPNREAKCSIAVPDVPQFRNLWRRLPAGAKSRTRITALFVGETGVVEET